MPKRISKQKPKSQVSPSSVKLIPIKGTSKRGGDIGGEAWKIEVLGKKVGIIFINLINEPPIGKHASIQIFLTIPNQGKGIGRIAYSLAVENSKHNIIYAHMRKSNIASQIAAEKAGFQKIILPNYPQLIMVHKRKKRKNPEQITIPESLFKQTGSRLKSYANVEHLLRRLERGLRLKQHHLSFVDTRKIFDIESGLLELVELVENG